MKEGGVVLLTGGTGFLGRNLIPRLLEKKSKIYVLSRSDNPSCLSSFLKDDRIFLVRGDVERDSIFYKDSDMGDIVNNVSQVIHTVASTSFFEREREKTFSLNVGGTYNMLEFSKKCKNLDSFVYVSTAYVENRRQGEEVSEDLQLVSHKNLSAGNPYEESKIAAEFPVRNSKLPWSIVRPAIFSGDSETGFTGYDYRTGQGVLLGLLYSIFGKNHDKFWKHREKLKDTSFFEYLEAPCRLKGYNTVTKNFMFIDDIAGQINAIVNSQNIVKKIHHVVTKNPITISQMINSIQKALRIRGVRFDGDFDVKSSNKEERKALKLIDAPYSSYFTRWEPHWRTDNTDRCLQEQGYERKDMTPEKFDWLMEQYVNNELKTVLKNFGKK